MKTIWVLCTIIALSFSAPTPRSLIDDLEDFIKILPVDDIKTIADEHLANDGALAAVIFYFQGPEWTDLVNTVGSRPPVQNFMAYLAEAGLPVENIISWIHNLITNAVPGVHPDENKSLRSLLDAIEEVLPTHNLIALLNDKMQNSPSFQEFYNKISSEEAHVLVEEVRAINEVQRIAQKLREMGVKVDETLTIVYQFLGWGEPKVNRSVESLIDDLLDFISLLPLDDIRPIVKGHLATDGAFVAVIVYLQGPEWADLMETIKNKPAVQNFAALLNEAGVPVDIILVFIHNLIANAAPGVDPDENASLRPFLDEVEAILPVDKLIDMLNDKMQNSPSFQDFYTKVSSEESHTLVQEIRAIDEVQRIGQKLRDIGVRVDAILEIVYEFLGWGTP